MPSSISQTEKDKYPGVLCNHIHAAIYHVVEVTETEWNGGFQGLWSWKNRERLEKRYELSVT